MNEQILMRELKTYIKNNFSPGELIWNHSYYKKKILTHNFKINKNFWDISRPIENSMHKLISFFKTKGIKLNFDNSIDYIWSFLNELAEKKYLELFKDKIIDNHTKLFMIQGKPKFSNDEVLIAGEQELYKLTLKVFLENNGNSIFFAREFNNDESLNFYKLIEKSIFKNFKLKTIMLETQPRSGNLNTRIYNEIKKSKYIIADITSSKNIINNNVIYEIGLAHGMKKKVLLIVNEKMKIFEKESLNYLPFDISPHTTINYSNNCKKINDSVNEIINTIKTDIKS